MDLEEIVKEHGIELAIEKISPKIAEKIKIYSETKDKNIQKELAQLLEDREKIYSNNKEIIQKYLE